MEIGKESAPIEVPIPVHPDDVPAEPEPAAEPVHTPEPEQVPA
jgi:hypothetical protein